MGVPVFVVMLQSIQVEILRNCALQMLQLHNDASLFPRKVLTLRISLNFPYSYYSVLNDYPYTI